MSFRRTTLLVAGLAVAVAILAAASQLLLLSFETDPLVSETRIDDIASWMQRRPVTGAGLLIGAAIAGAGLSLLWTTVRPGGTDGRVLTTRRSSGWTKLDRPTLEDALERRLESIDRRNDVSAKIGRSGRVDLEIITPDPSRIGPAQELRDAVDAYCEARALPCRSGRITATTPRRSTSRRRVR